MTQVGPAAERLNGILNSQPRQQQPDARLPPIITPSISPSPSMFGFFPAQAEAADTNTATTTQLHQPAFATSTSTATSTASADTTTTTTAATNASSTDASTASLLAPLPTVRCLVRARIPMTIGTEVWLHLYENSVDSKEHLALVFGPHIMSRSLNERRPGETEMDRMVRGAYEGRLYPGRTASSGDPTSPGARPDSPHAVLDSAIAAAERGLELPLVRIHSECYTGETAWSARCDCGEQLDEAARLMSQLPEDTSRGGVIVYLRQEGRGIGLVEKLKAYNLQDLGNDTVEANLLLRHPADARSYGLATAMLLDLGLPEVRLLTNNPDKVRAVEGPNREVVVKEKVAMVPKTWRGEDGVKGAELEGYLRTKIEKMGHMLDMGSMPRRP